MNAAAPMPRSAAGRSGAVLALVTALALLYIWSSAHALPPIVASHFGPSGVPNGFMPRRSYLGVMMIIVLAVPVLTTVGMGSMLRRPGARINLPHRDYWLAPERREDTVTVLLGHMRLFAVALVLLLTYVHGLVVSANARLPPLLDSTLMMRALGVFLLFTITWIVMLLRRFRR